MFFRAKQTLLITLIMLTCSGVNAQVYKWTDENGNVHFGDRPPESGNAQNISDSMKPLNISTDLSNPRLIERAERERMQNDQNNPEVQRKQQREAEKKRIECNELRNRLIYIQGPVAFLDKDGNEVKVTEAERKERVIALQARITEECSQ